MATEFVCAGCRLIYPDSELAVIDGDRVCADCAADAGPMARESRPGGNSRAITTARPLTIQRMAKWLADHVPTIMLSDFAAELVDEINDAIANAWRAVDRPAEKHLLGPCGAETESGECMEFVYAIERQKWALCRSCGAEHDVHERREWMLEQIRSRRGTAAEISEELRLLAGYEIAAGTIRQWKKRGKLEADDENRYLFGDVLDLHRELSSPDLTLASSTD